MFGLGFYDINFGLLTPGDIITISDDCGSTPYSVTVTDDYTYVEVAPGISQAGNGIGSTDTFLPYNKLNTPLAVGQCEVMNVNAHGLFNYSIYGSSYVGGTAILIGKFSVNGSPIQATDYTVQYNGYQQAVNYSVGVDGSLTTDGPVRFDSKAYYSGRTPLTIAYTHNGASSTGDLAMGMGALSFDHIGNNSVQILQATPAGGVVTTDYSGNFSHSTFTITFDGQNYKAFIDDILYQTLPRFVVYTTNIGSLSSSSVLPYGTGVTVQPTNPGRGYVSVLIDGVLYTQQQVQVADNLGINPTIINAACTGTATGSISLTATGGKAPFQYSINGGNYGTANQFSNLAAGNYTLGVRDASGCTATRIATVSQPQPLAISIGSQTNVSCAGGNDGSISLNASGGITNYSYSRDGTTFLTTNTFTGLSAGAYSFTVKDAVGCLATTQATLINRSNFSLSVSSITSPACYGTTTGRINLTTTGNPSGTINYRLNGGAVQTSSQFSNLGAGNYTIIATDDLCSSTQLLTLNQPSAVQASVLVANAISCYGGAGILSVAATGGVGGYTYSSDNSTFLTTAQFDGQSAGNYKFWVKDQNGCLASTDIFTLAAPPALVLTLSDRRDANCFGSATGSLAVTSSGGTTPYQYAINNGNYSSSAQFNGISAGNYTVSLVDGGGCTTSLTATIGQPTALTGGVASQQPITCGGGADGAVSLSATGGTGPYTYSQDGTLFGTQSNFTGLSEGSYSYTVQDANGCRQPITMTLTARSRLTLTIASLTAVGCFGGSSGLVQGDATGSVAVGPIRFSIDGTSYQPSATFAGLSAASYILRLRDDLCQVSLSFSISQPTALSAGANVLAHVSCFNTSTAKIRTSANGGTLPYTYSLNGTTFQADKDIGQLMAGSYTVLVRDANGCTLTTAPVSLTQPPVLQLSIAGQTDVRCHQGSDGIVTLTATGGTPVYQYALSDNNFVSTGTFTGLKASQYMAQVTDNQGCLTSLSVTVGQPLAPFSLSLLSKTNLTCYIDQSGQMTIGGQGGTSPYSLTLGTSGSNSQPAPATFTSLAAGSYIVQGKDAKGCTTELTGITIAQPDQVVLTLRQLTQVDCEYYTKGAVTFSAVGGNSNYTFSLQGQSRLGITVQPSPNTSGQFTSLPTGNFVVTARDGAGCTGEYSVSLQARNSAIRFSVKADIPSACNANDGQIVVSGVGGGHPPYTYAISGNPVFQASAQFGGLTGGSYLVTVADSLCTYTQPVSLTLQSSLRASYTLTPRDCRSPNADLTLSGVSGGSGSYRYSLNGGAMTTDPAFTNLSPGLYTVRLEDIPLGCPTVLSLEVLPLNSAGLRLTDRQAVRCYGGNDGGLTLTAEAQSGPFRYAIDGGSFGSASTFGGLVSGWHQVVVQTALGCLDSMRILITQPPRLDLSVLPRHNDCQGDQTGAFTVSASGGVTPYVFSADGSSYANGPVLSSLSAGNYTVRVRDSNGCITSQGTSLTQPALLTLQTLYADTVRCNGERNGRVQLVAVGGTPNYQYSIDSISFVSTASYAGLSAGSYRFWLRDSHACITTSRQKVSEPEPLRLVLLTQSNPLCYGDSSGKAQVLASGGNGSYRYGINSGAGLLGEGQPGGQMTGLTQASYGFRVIDRRGCTDTTTRIQLIWPAPIRSQTTLEQPRCFGQSNGQITVQLNGGTPPYLSSPSSPVSAAQPVSSPLFRFTGLRAGAYTLPFTDSQGCRYGVSTRLDQPSALSLVATVKPNDCFGDQTGGISLRGAGATPPYRFGLTSDSSRVISGQYSQLRSGDYEAGAVDANGCRVNETISVRQPPLVTLRALYADTIRCFGEANGKVLLIAGGGVGGYQYAQDTSRYYVDPTFGGFVAGTYTFYVKDQNGCRQQSSLPLSQPNVLKLSLLDKANPLCAGEANGRIQIGSVGGNGGYRYQLDNGSPQREGLFTGLTQGAYTLKSVDRRGCQDTIRRVALVWPQPLAASVAAQSPRCTGEANGSIGVLASGGIGGYQVWLGTTPQLTGIGDSLRLTGLTANAYSLRIADGNGCQVSLSARIAAPQAIQPILLGDSVTTCKGQQVTLDANNPGLPTSWYLDGRMIAQQPVYTATQPGTYSVAVTNTTGCIRSATFTLKNSTNALLADFLIPTQAFVGDSITCLDITKPIPESISWSLPNQLFFVKGTSSTISFVGVSPGSYTVRMKAVKGDCNNIAQHTIQLFEPAEIANTDPKLGYQETNLIASLTVFPNPNYGRFTVQIKLSRVNPVIVDIIRVQTGETVYTTQGSGLYDYTFPVAIGVSNGLYIVRARSNTSTLLTRILILN